MSHWKRRYGKPDKPRSNFRIVSAGSRRHDVEQYRYGMWEMVGRYTKLTMARSALDQLELKHLRRVASIK